MRAGRRLAVIGLALLARAGLAQNQIATQDLWALDYATSTIHIFRGNSQAISPSIVLAGTGSVRGFGFNDAGLAYVAQGQEVRTYDTVTTSVFAGAASGIDQAQHVAVRPGSAQEVWVACGTATSNSKLIKFSSTGTALATLTNSLVVHPRRIAWNQDGTLLFIACNGNKKIVTLDPTTGAFVQLIDLTALNMAPIGIAFDATRGAVWIVGDFGFNGDIGFVNTTTGVYSNVLTEGVYPGLSAAANVYFDRYRVLTVAARNLNSGIGGLYRFNAPTGTSISDLGPILGGLTSVIDVAPRPEVIGIGAPVSGTSFVLNASMSMPVANTITFNAPRAANRVYAAALSPRWQSSCAPYIPGIIEPGLRTPLPDARGVPLSTADGGFLLGQSAAVCCDIATPFPLNTILTINGFTGVLSATGTATGTVTFLPAPPMINGVPLSLAFITVDPSSFDLFDRISDPICLTIAVGP